MIDFKVKVEDTSSRVTDAVKKTAFRNFSHAAASIRKDAASTLERAEGPSEPGSPPHTHKGSQLKRSLRYDADERGAVIGPLASMVGESAAAHEFGGVYKGTDFDERPFMQPALDRAIPRLGGDWAGAVGE